MHDPLADGDFARLLRDSSGDHRSTESATVTTTIKSLGLQLHPEGGYYAETDRDILLIPNPFNLPDGSTGARADSDTTRNASTTIFYLLTPRSPVGHFHRNKARTVHTLHSGKGRYVIVHEDGRLETFVAGHDLARGERLQWIVEGGKYKASYLLPDEDSRDSESGLLISETVVPGWTPADFNFLTANDFGSLLGKDKIKSLGWLLNAEERKTLSTQS